MSTTWNRSLRGFALSLCFVMVIAPVVRAEVMVANTGVLRASVTVGASHTPVELITIRVVDLETAEEVAVATTDESGVVELPGLPFGTYHVSALAPDGFVASAGPLVTVNAEALAPEVAITLSPAQEGQEDDDDCEDGDDECVAALALAAAAAAGGGGGTGLFLLGILGAAGIALGIAGVVGPDDGGADVITQ